ncbi:MAG: hypothetical protein V7752_18780 [Halopseudomonas sp.]
MPKANELNYGEFIEKDGKLNIVRNSVIELPSSRAVQTLYKTHFSRITSCKLMSRV